MLSLIDIKLLLGLIIFSYSFGNISPSIILSKYIYKIDIRDHGSGNPGTTNALRVMGKRVGAVVFILDMLKGVIPTWIGYRLGGQELAYIMGICVVIGHIFPIFLKFKGGKGVATSFGAAIVIHPLFAILSILVFALIVFKTRYVSLGSILGTSMFAVLIIITGAPNMYKIYSLIFVSLVVFAHRKNISNLLNGTEKKLGEKNKEK